MIPKIIHLCWLSGDPYPEKIQYCIDSWKRYLPDYEIMLWDTNRFDVNSLPWTKQAFEVKKYAFVADYIRFYAVYNYGGIYLDSDVEVIKPFDDLLHLPYFVGVEAVPDGIELAAFGAEKGTQWVKDCMDYYPGRNFIGENGEMSLTPMPYIMGSLIRGHYAWTPVKSIAEFDPDPSRFCIFPQDRFNVHHYDDDQNLLYDVTDDTYCIHHFTNSWMPQVNMRGPLHRLYFLISGKDWRVDYKHVRLYGKGKIKKNKKK